MQFFDAIRKSGNFQGRSRKKRYTEFLAPKVLSHTQNSSTHQKLCGFQKLTSRAKYAYVIVLLRCALDKVIKFLTPHTEQPENLRLTVSVFLCTFEPTALLLKKFHFQLRSDTLPNT